MRSNTFRARVVKPASQSHQVNVTSSASVVGLMTACYSQPTMKTSRLRERVVICSVALLGFGVAGCSSEDAPANEQPNYTGGAGGTGGSGGTKPFELEFRLDDVQPGVEGTRCIQVRLPN